jgi:hypothetical protein
MSCMLRLLVSTRFQVLFHSAPAVLFTFPSRYYPLSVAKEYLALGGGPPRFPRDFSCPAVLGVCCTFHNPFRLPGSHRLWPAFPCRSPTNCFLLAPCRLPPTAPRPRIRIDCSLYHVYGLGFSAFARHYLRNRVRFLFLEVLRCFSSLGCLRHTYVFSVRY